MLSAPHPAHPVPERPGPAAPRRYWLWGLALAVALTAIIASSIRNFERLRNEAAFQAAAVERIDRLDGSIERALAGLTSLAAYFDASPDLDRADFQRLAQPFLQAGSPVQALEWVPRVTADGRRTLVEAARRSGLDRYEITERSDTGSLVPAAARAEYFPVLYVAPLAGNERALGFDLASNPVRRAALERAYSTRAAAATGRVTLVQERADQFGFLAFRPVFRGAGTVGRAARRQALAGFVLSVMRIGDIVAGSAGPGAAPSDGAASTIDLTLVDEDAAPGERLLYPPSPAAQAAVARAAGAAGGLELRRAITVAGRSWTVLARPAARSYVAEHLVSNAVLLLGSVLALVWTAYLRRLLQIKYESEAAAARHMAALQEERNFNEAILGAAGALIVVTDLEGRIVRFNRAAERFTGASFAQMQGQPFAWNRFRLPHERAARNDAFEEFRAGTEPRRFSRIWLDAAGEQRLIDWTASTIGDAKGAPQYMIALGLDITAQKRLEEAARDQEARLRTILENLAEGVCTLDAQGRVSYLNARAQEMLGWSLAELAGRSMLEFIRDPACQDGAAVDQHPIFQALRQRRVYRSSDEVFYCKGGARLPVKVSSAPLLAGAADGDGAAPADAPGAAGLVVMFSDVRAERLLQQRLVEAKEAAEAAARSKADFLSTMSHEIRTPLNGVIGMTDILLDTELGPEQIEFVRIIKTSADALNGTIDDILDFSKIEAGRLELERIEFSLQQVIESSVDIVGLRAREKNLSLASYIDPGLPDHFIGDPLRIRQVLLNFLSNAVKFSSRGQILVSGMSAARGAAAAAQGVRISVRDNGIGIPRDAQARLFQPFSQADTSTSRKYGGTGLGLAICKRLVEAMGGQIGVDSEAGSGATFWMVLPLPAAQAAPVDASGVRDQRVLIAGDDAELRALWQRYVEGWRMRCEVAPDLATLRAQIARLLAAGERVDAVLLAQPLPDADLEQAVQALRPHISTILCCLDEGQREATAGAEGAAALRTRLAALGAVVLPKPTRQSTLLDALMLAWSRSCPVADAEAAPAPAPRPQPRATAGHHRLLLAEDNAVNQRVATVVLERIGYAVDVVDNGKEAVAHAGAGDYAAVLMDCQMPELDGFQATAAIRRAEAGSGRRLPIIAMTANALDGDRERCLAAGMDDYLPKPIDAAALRAVLARWITAQAPGAPAGATGSDDAHTLTVVDAAPADPARVASAQTPAVELDRLIEMFGDERETIAELLQVFRGSIEQTRDALARDLGLPGPRVKALAHEIKGMAANMGAGRLAHLAALLEESAERQDPAQIERLGRALQAELPRVLAFIDAYLQG